MREDQIKRLDDLAENVTDVFLEAASPENWTGAGQDPQAMTPEIRGARNWDVKNANQIGALLARCMDLRDRITIGSEDSDDEAEADIGKYEKAAKTLVKKIAERHG
jgi:hypothetical protein